MKHSFRIIPWGVALICLSVATNLAAAAKRPFTVTEEIGIADFGDLSHSGRIAPITWSPDRKWVAVVSARGRLAANKVEAELRIYDVSALRHFATQPSRARPPEPLWSIVRSDYKAGPLMEELHWTPDSSAVAFRLTPADGGSRLMYADLKSKTLSTLSRADQRVMAFDVVDRNHYVYAVQDPAVHRQVIERDAAAAVLTGRSLQELLFPSDLYPDVAALDDRSQVWQSKGGEPTRLLNPHTGAPLILFHAGTSSLRLSPDGRRLFTALPVEEIPPQWDGAYPPSTPNYPYRAVAGHQELDTLQGFRLISRYVLIDLASGEITVPVDSPTGNASGWWTGAAPAWSADSREIAVGNLFVPDTGSNSPVIPCVAIIDVATASARCVEKLKLRYTPAGAPSPGYDHPVSLRFDLQDHALNIEYQTEANQNGLRRYLHTSQQSWSLAGASDKTPDAVRIEIRQSDAEPPVLTAATPGGGAPHVVWDPNPQLQQVDLPKTLLLHWQDETGRKWSGGLYVPANYRPGQRYPLVIQTHGYFPDVFRPSGLFPTGYAARALAASGILVLEARCVTQGATAEEGPCQAPGYEAAVKMLAADNTIDPERVGIVGFSRTCYYVMEVLTRSKLHFSAATTTDGVNEGYWQYLFSADSGNNSLAHEADAMNGAVPWGPGLAIWLKNAPLFNMDKVDTPIQVVGEGMASLLTMWEPYALLRYQKKPVELVMLNTGEHVLTTPDVRLASQGGMVDWMRFWLLGAEDPAPAKDEQYRRWEQLCDQQVATAGGKPVFCVGTKH